MFAPGGSTARGQGPRLSNGLRWRPLNTQGGPACAEPAAAPAGSTPCPNDCSGRGICEERPSGGAACVCATGFSGPSCTEENVCPADCNLHGLCVRRRCLCAPGYSGRACETRLPPSPHNVQHGADDCPNRCWGRGACIVERAGGSLRGRCECDPGFSGSDCASVVPCPDACSQRGVCSRGSCFCDPGWSGVNCSTPEGCPRGCSGHGTCVSGSCFCDLGYEGADCSVAPPPKLRAELERNTVAAIGGATIGLSFAIGLTLKVFADRRRRALLLRYIQESDAQTPFVSSEFSKAMSS